MPQGTAVNQSNFEKLLVWIAGPGDDPGEVYELLRRRLMKFFYARGCQTADELADETIERVTQKIDSLIVTYDGDPRLYFYGVAKNVFREHLRKPVSENLPLHLAQDPNPSGERENRDRCLTNCLSELQDDEREFILDYYQGERSVKIENRQKIMDRLELTPQALRVRAYRVRAKLQKCVFRCLDMKPA